MNNIKALPGCFCGSCQLGQTIDGTISHNKVLMGSGKFCMPRLGK